MGAGGDVFGDINGYDGGDWGLRDTKVRSLHNVMKEDLNILYRVEREGKELYSNSDTLTSSTTAAQLPMAMDSCSSSTERRSGPGGTVSSWTSMVMATTAIRTLTSPISGMSPATKTLP